VGEILAQRVTAELSEPFVVFLIGMRVNKFFAFKKWGVAFNSFPKMLNELYAHPELGFLHGETFYCLKPIMPVMISYWRSFDHLERFARSRDHTHLPAWREFYKQVGTDGTVGIWHETYTIAPGQYESIYANMPLFGLAKAAGKVTPVGRSNGNARQRVANNPEAAGYSVPLAETEAGLEAAPHP
jgi:hypothetical protein